MRADTRMRRRDVQYTYTRDNSPTLRHTDLHIHTAHQIVNAASIRNV